MTQTIEQLTARIAELEEENKQLEDDCGYQMQWKREFREQLEYSQKQLAASQAYAEQLRDACAIAEKTIDIVWVSHHANRCDHALELCRKALATPTSTEALDAYVAGKVTRPNFRQMREMLRAMQAGELTVSRGIEILDIWHAGNWNDDMLPPARQDLIEEDSMPVEIIDRLTRQRDLAVEAIENLVDQKGRHNTEIAYKRLVKVLSAIKGSEK